MEDDDQVAPAPRATDAIDAAPREGLAELFVELFQWMGRGGRERLGQGARVSRRAMEKYQAKRDVDRLYQKLGRESIRLVQAGEISHPGLEARIPRIREEEERLRALTTEFEAEE